MDYNRCDSEVEFNRSTSNERQYSRIEQAVALALNLSPLDKVRLVEQVMATLEQHLAQSQIKPKRSLYGLWSDENVSEADID